VTPPQKYLTVYELGDDPTTVIAALSERGRAGLISRGDTSDRASVSMWVYSPRTERITG
jgi:hypothetical protein